MKCNCTTNRQREQHECRNRSELSSGKKDTVVILSHCFEMHMIFLASVNCLVIEFSFLIFEDDLREDFFNQLSRIIQKWRQTLLLFIRNFFDSTIEVNQRCLVKIDSSLSNIFHEGMRIVQEN